MKRSRASRGQILLLLILLMLFGFVLILGLQFRFSRIQRSPIMRDAFWQVDDRDVSVVRLGEEVEATVVIKATDPYRGSLAVKIRKDLRLWPDSNYHVSTFPINLEGGEQGTIDVSFTPDEATRGSLRGYFIEVEFLATGTAWTMENSYPPRLRVTAAEPVSSIST